MLAPRLRPLILGCLLAGPPLGCGADGDAPSRAGSQPHVENGPPGSHPSDVGGGSDTLPPPPPPEDVDPEVHGCREAGRFEIGAGIADITGPITEISTGYNSPGEMMEGLGMRLYSRAFVIHSPCSGQRVAFVSADVLHLYESIKQGVVERLQTRLPGVYHDANTMVTGTHTHAAPSNISFHTLYNLFNGAVGFDELNYDRVVDGIVESIVAAHHHLVPGRITLARGRVEGAATNRSRPAYAANLDASDYDADVDDSMVLLKLTADDGRELGFINWFAVHGTSLSQNNRLVHGDNKGWGAYHFDRGGARLEGGVPYVAAFAQGAMGDVSPNRLDPAEPEGPFRRPSDDDPDLHELDNARVHGELQAHAARALLDEPGEPVAGGVFFRHRNVPFQHLPVDPAYAGVPGASTCVAAIGAGFAAGSEEGSPSILGGVAEGELVYGGEAAGPTVDPAVQHCQGEKPVLLQVGDVSSWWVNDVPWVSTSVPVQLFVIGQVALVASSFEVTTMAGRRLRRLLASTLSPIGVEEVIVAGIANSYTHYLTTREEYALQHFEGAFTQFGPFSEAAFRQENDRVARALVTGEALDPGVSPPDLSGAQAVRTQIDQNGVVNDAPPLLAAFGDVVADVEASYAAGERAEVTFWSCHPRTYLLLAQEGRVHEYVDPARFHFVAVQRQTESGWETILTESDPDTYFHWQRIGGSLSPESQATVGWDLRAAEPGTYRIVHHGLAKQSLVGLLPQYVPFTAASATFTVR